MSITQPRISNMASNPLVTGPTAQRTAENVERIRRARGLDQKELSARMAEVGRPMLASVISKVERGDRRVDVDDLVALAVALDTTPDRLMLSAGASETETVALTSEIAVTEQTAWLWASGDQALPTGPWVSRSRTDELSRGSRFLHENRPHDPPVANPWADLAKNADVLEDLNRVVQTLRHRGMSVVEIANFVELSGFVTATATALSDMAAGKDEPTE